MRNRNFLAIAGFVFCLGFGIAALASVVSMETSGVRTTGRVVGVGPSYDRTTGPIVEFVDENGTSRRSLPLYCHDPCPLETGSEIPIIYPNRMPSLADVDSPQYRVEGTALLLLLCAAGCTWCLAYARG
jgi:hypothetical protein